MIDLLAVMTRFALQQPPNHAGSKGAPGQRQFWQNFGFDDGRTL
jgi:hypothetical protein